MTLSQIITGVFFIAIGIFLAFWTGAYLKLNARVVKIYPGGEYKPNNRAKIIFRIWGIVFILAGLLFIILGFLE